MSNTWNSDERQTHYGQENRVKEGESTLRVAGLRTYRRACGHPMTQARTSRTLASLMACLSVDSFLDSLRSGGAAINAIRAPPAVMNSEVQSLPSKLQPLGDLREAVDGHRKHSITAMQRLSADKTEGGGACATLPIPG